MDDFWTFIANAALFYLAFKLGQISVWTKIGQANKEDFRVQLQQVRQSGLRPIITVEQINGVYYAYDGNDFLAQGNTAEEIGQLIAKRYPNKYALAKVEIKA